MTDATAIHRAQLADMPWNTIEAWLLEQGYVIVGRDWHRSAVQALLMPFSAMDRPSSADYTPEALPFDREGR